MINYINEDLQNLIFTAIRINVTEAIVITGTVRLRRSPKEITVTIVVADHNLNEKTVASTMTPYLQISFYILAILDMKDLPNKLWRFEPSFCLYSFKDIEGPTNI